MTDTIRIDATIDLADSARRIFARAKELLAAPDDWRRTHDSPRNLRRRTLPEAIAKAAEETTGNAHAKAAGATYILAQMLPNYPSLSWWNDDPHRTHEDILGLLYDATVICDHIVPGDENLAWHNH